MALARALAQQPDIILADEPTGNLDSATGEEIMAIFDSLHAEGQTIIIVTHEDGIARRCRRTIKLLDGQIVVDTGINPGSGGPSGKGAQLGEGVQPGKGTQPGATEGAGS